jgi:CheY-like chemotaxis protein
MNCGHVHDSVIEQNRLARQEKVVALPSGEPDYQDDEVHLGVESIIRQAAWRNLAVRPSMPTRRTWPEAWANPCGRVMATILIIDDEQNIRALLRFALESAGYEVMEATNGRQGLERYRHRPADLVITDILMPELNGLDMILELTRAFLNVKVIAISGAPDTQDALDAAKLLGVRHTVHKPFSMEALLKTVQYELAHWTGTELPIRWIVSRGPAAHAAVGVAEEVGGSNGTVRRKRKRN